MRVRSTSRQQCVRVGWSKAANATPARSGVRKDCGKGGIRPPSRSALRWTAFAWLANRSSRRWEAGAKVGGEGGIRTPVPVTRQDAFEAPPLRPLRYLSIYHYARWGPFHIPHLAARSGRRCAAVPSGPRLRPQARCHFARWGPFTFPTSLRARAAAARRFPPALACGRRRDRLIAFP